ncbi:MAG TPA: LysE family translocator [Anaerolineales bacterium]|nr:LysE family translocator [Anaerolineales bacterium]
MFDSTQFGLFILASWALIIAPGPDMLYVITRGIAHGRRAGILSAVGVVCGILVHTTTAALGLAIILQASTAAFLIVKFVGVIYLLYLGIKSLRDKSTFQLQEHTSAVSSHKLFWQGVLSNVLNPKVAIFFLAFLPQFVDRTGGPIGLQMVMLGLTFALFGLCFLAVVGYFAGAIGSWLTRRPQYTNILRWLTGGVLIGLGVRLAFTERR